jgi:arylsulfatase A-like enzyme
LFQSANWDDLRKHQPFFAQINLPVVELSPVGWVGSSENPWNGTSHPSLVDPEQITPPPYYPDHSVTRQEWAKYLDAVCGMDQRVGQILERLAADSLADDTIVIFFADNARLTLRGLDWCYDSGDRVPLLVRWPKNFPTPKQYRAGSVRRQLVSLIDVAATTLALAGISKPANMHGRVILGPDADPPRTFVVTARDRCDEAVNRIRAVRTERFRYIRNFFPEKAFMSLHRYKAACYPVMRLMYQLHDEGKLTAVQKRLMAPRLPDEELYDVSSDPHEINNLVNSPDPEHQRVLKVLRDRLNRWMEETDDKGRYPESPEVIEYWTRAMDEEYGVPDWYRLPQK